VAIAAGFSEVKRLLIGRRLWLFSRVHGFVSLGQKAVERINIALPMSFPRQLGHGPEAFADANYRRLLAPSIQFTAKRRVQSP
jgi:hypothetical protein